MTFPFDAADRERLWADRHRRLVENVAPGRRAKINVSFSFVFRHDPRFPSGKCIRNALQTIVQLNSWTDGISTQVHVSAGSLLGVRHGND